MNLLFSLSEYITTNPLLSIFLGAVALLIIIYIIPKITRKKDLEKELDNIIETLDKNPEKGMEKLTKSSPLIIERFLKEKRLPSQQYVKVKEYLSQPSIIRKLHNSAQDMNTQEKLALINILAELGTPQAEDYLLTYLYEPEEEVSRKTIITIPELKSNKKIPTLINYLKYTEDTKTLNYMEESIFALGDKALRKLAEYISQNPDPKLQNWALDVMGKAQQDEEQYSSKDFTNTFIKQLEIDNPEIKVTALNNLAEFEGEKIDRALVKSLYDQNWGVRAQAAKLLGERQYKPATDELANLLEDKSGIVRDAAARALMELGYDGIKHLINKAREVSPPSEIVKVLKEQDISFLIKSMEKIYEEYELPKKE